MRAALLVLLVGCAGSFGPQGQPDGNQNADGNSGCGIDFTFDPPQNPSPHAGPGAVERATASLVNFFGGVPKFSWFVNRDGGSPVTTTALGDGSVIDFPIDVAGDYDVNLQVTSDFSGTCGNDIHLNVVDSGAKVTSYRVRVAPPQASLPTIEEDVQVLGGGDQTINLPYPPLANASGTVVYNSAPVLAYVRIAPPGSSAYVEAFTDGNGQFNSLQVLAGAEEVTIVPLVPGPAPKLVHWDTSQFNVFTLDGGSPVTGTVKTAANGGVAGAKVQLLLGGRLPSTIATTAADGSFTVQADLSDPNLASQSSISVVPSAASGLPRLTQANAFDLASPFTVKYGAIATRDLASVPIKQGGNPVANATVAIVGAVGATAGTIDGSVATDAIHAVAKTDASGKIAGSTVVPATSVQVVVTLSSGEVELATVDLTAGVPASIALPAQATATGVVTDSTTAPLAGVLVELVPDEALSAAGTQPVQTVTSPTGAYAVHLASAGTYDLRVVDPQGRGPLVFRAAQTPAQLGDIQLDPGLHVAGTVTLPDLSVVPNASVQFVCTGCNELRPVAESSTDLNGQYRVGIPDPGVN